uniref:Uncharacterized protein n=1 Tax=Anaplasma phagocytophilum TaxID=948 RepID=W6DA57_ANAPH|nr:hypothetical protein [Anaplasma phagocytophilum]AHI96439.1 hypothetical protein [Anaplasma phagocytophilum]AHI96441.1 hypothetical protein [Anaplasma phagocytophilum]AHI96445.1 hypothetical protein [Anaplasma phagocytophilum]AHI96447.1 hypothetical protein [Anaplasma phagocytophilum]
MTSGLSGRFKIF